MHIATKDFVIGVLKGDRRILSKAITLVESKLPADQDQAQSLFHHLAQHTRDRPALRIGLSGSPGVGKSSFIEALGLYLTKSIDKSLAVLVSDSCVQLAIDPSSQISGGSILGDKTRMPALSSHPKAYIRPTPSQCDLGGVVRTSYDSIRLCEYAGFDVILVESVGVGQSELMLAHLVDIFVLLVAPGGGDELQGIKKGITEVADLVLVNKCDPPLSTEAKLTLFEYKSALKFRRPLYEGLQQDFKVQPVSAKAGTGIAEAWESMQQLASNLGVPPKVLIGHSSLIT